jgi:prepilin-type N-terminal cleavage/methylation domain-containing protein
MTPKSLQTAPRRHGFSLIELLVVIAIIAILCALLAAAIMRMLTVPPQKNTELLIQKLAQSLEQQWAAVITQCKTENPNESPQTAAMWAAAQGSGPDPQNIMNTYVNLRLQQEFPTTFAAAAASGKAIFAGLAAPPPPTPQGNGFEGSILLYLTLTVGRRGMEFDAGTLAPREARQVPGFGPDVRAIYDGWDQPIQFELLRDPNNTGSVKFRIFSAGADRIPGNADDVNSDNLRLGR